jgi:hypothetical protein
VAITNYGELKSAVADWLNRTDLTTHIPEFIELAEATIARRVRRKTIRASMFIDDEENAVTVECAELRSIRLSTSNAAADYPLDIVGVEELFRHRAQRGGVAGRPVVAAVYQGAILVSPPPDATYTAIIHYYEALSPLADGTDVDSNTILTEAPDVYLYGTLAQAARFLQHDERIPVWEAAFEKGMAELEIQREREENNASIRAARLPRVFG